MRLINFKSEQSPRKLGAMVGERVVDLCATDPSLPDTTQGLLAAGPGVWQQARQAAESPSATVVSKSRLLAPLASPGKILCIGLNYRDHAAESGVDVPREPVVFSKFTNTIVGPDDEIVLPRVSNQVDYEAELVAVIGKRAKHVAVEQALDYVFGYTVGNDVSARDWQLQKDGKQWLLGKTFDTFAPIGPAIVSADEVGDPQGLAIGLRLNGESMQQSSTSQMAFSVAELVAYVSQVATLEPGDLIFTGTPPGVGFARKPPVFLKPGDVCEVSIERVGVLQNRCVADA